MEKRDKFIAFYGRTFFISFFNTFEFNNLKSIRVDKEFINLKVD